MCKLVFEGDKFDNIVFVGNLIAKKMAGNGNMFYAGMEQGIASKISGSNVQCENAMY